MFLGRTLILYLVSFGFSTPARPLEFVLLGSTGDLAKKYLYKSLSDIVLNYPDLQMNIFATARNEQEDLDRLLAQSVPSIDKMFRQAITYKQLKTIDHYRSLCNSFNVDSANIIFYLAIPPFAYVDCVQMISEGCRSFLSSGKIKIVIEKPFGSNYTSAKSMSDSIAKHVADQFIYRIDHYLGKGIVREMLAFREKNKEIEALLSRQTVSSVEIGLLEELGCKGRTEFYNEYGIIRDVMQNHMTELLLLSLLDLPVNISSSSAVCAAKAVLLQDLAGPGPSGLLLGQYSGYPGEWAKETQRLSAKDTNPLHPSEAVDTRTPTFAALTLAVHNPRWFGVPVVLVSGKRMASKASFVRFLFDSRDLLCPHCPATQELLFLISEGLILCSHGLACSPTAALQRTDVPAGLERLLSVPPQFYEAFRLRRPAAASYTNLILDAIAGRRENFVSEAQLLSSWRTWSSVLRSAEKLPLKLYSSPAALQFRRTKWSLQWTSIEDVERGASLSSPLDRLRTDKEQPVVAAGPALAAALAQRIVAAAAAALEQRDVFHMALPGGTSALQLMAALRELRPALNWAKVHLWLTDERCVGRADPAANINTLDRHLLRHIAIPLANVHGVSLASDPRRSCINDVAGEYEAELQSVVGPEGRLDFVVLGAGRDGHTASLFPDDEATLKSHRLVTLSAVRGSPPVRRLSLTFRALAASRELALLLVGEGKEAVAKNLLANLGSLRNVERQSFTLKPFLRVLQRSKASVFIEKHLSAVDSFTL